MKPRKESEGPRRPAAELGVLRSQGLDGWPAGTWGGMDKPPAREVSRVALRVPRGKVEGNGQGAAEAVAQKQEVQGAPEDSGPSQEDGVLGADRRGQLAEVGSRAAAREDEKMGFQQSPCAL